MNLLVRRYGGAWVPQSIFYLGNPAKSSRPEVFCKKVVLRNFAKFTRKHLCQSVPPVPQPCNFIKIESTFFYRTLLVTNSALHITPMFKLSREAILNSVCFGNVVSSCKIHFPVTTGHIYLLKAYLECYLFLFL